MFFVVFFFVFFKWKIAKISRMSRKICLVSFERIEKIIDFRFSFESGKKFMPVGPNLDKKIGGGVSI